MEIGERTIFDKAQSRGVIRLSFAGESGDNVSADSCVWKALTDEFNAAGIMFGAVPAMHGGEDAVRARLQRHMEVWRDAIGGSKEIDEILGNVKRFDGAKSKTFHWCLANDVAEKIEEFDTRRKVAAIGAEINTTENDLPKA